MKLTTLRLNTFSIKIIAVLFTLFFNACSTRMTFVTSTVVPAAEGSIKVNKDNNGNYNLDLAVKRLSDPSRLTPSKSLYVVWMETDGNGTKNIGQLKSESGFFTSELTASLHTVSAFKPERIFVTAENDASIKNPGS